MRILVHDFVGHAFPLQLSRSLAERGHVVLHLYCGAYPGGKGRIDRQHGDAAGLSIESLGPEAPFERYSLLRRVASEFSYGGELARRIASFEPDAVLSANTPLVSQAFAIRSSRRVSARFVFWQQDVLAVAIDLALRRRLGWLGGLVGRAFRQLEKTILEQSDEVVVVSSDFLSQLSEWRLDVSDYHVVENWAPREELPECPRSNAWSTAHDLDDKFVFLYAGTLGLKHNHHLLRTLAEHLTGRATVVVVAAGLGAEALQDMQRRVPLANLILLEPVSYEDLPQLHGAADVLVVLLAAEAATFSVPSKILAYLCARRPILAALPRQNLAHRLLERAGAGALVDPDDITGFLAAADRLFADGMLRERLAEAAVRYANSAFDIGQITERFESILGERRTLEAPTPVLV